MHIFSYLKKNPASLMIHLAFIIILAGAFTTHFSGVTGKITLSVGSAPADRFFVESGPSDGHMPFTMKLVDAEILYYPGTTTPMDYRSVVEFTAADGSMRVDTISMNNIAIFDNLRFYQTGMADGSSTFSVSHDPLGIGITYAGYALLIISMILFFFQPHTAWRGWLRKVSSGATVAIIFLSFPTGSAFAADSLPVVQRPLAKKFGDIFVYWNDRVSPMQTMAKDVAMTLYGSQSYKGHTSEQILTGWLFYYDAWLKDFEQTNQTVTLSTKKKKRLEEKKALIYWLGTGEAFRIFPYHAATGRLEWLSLAGSRPSKMETGQWLFMTHAMDDIASDISKGRNLSAGEKIDQLILNQRKYAGEAFLPSASRIKVEKLYNRYLFLLPVAIALLCLGFISLLTVSSGKTGGKRYLGAVTAAAGALSLIYLLAVAVARGYVGGHIPMSNGFETMLCMSIICLAGALASPSGIKVIRPALMIVAGAALAVGVMGDTHPGIGTLTPVLASPLLSIHVMLVITSYALLFLMTILAIRSLVVSDSEISDSDVTLNHVLIIPAVFLLAAGIFIGAIWANQSWGRYWGWDPKETCALLTMLVYSVPLHTRSLKIFRKKKIFSIYIIIAFSCVLFTYFGANYLLPGLHSYA